MGYFDTMEGVNQYIQMTSDYDGSWLINEFKKFVPVGSSVLEIGMGPGKDLDLLRIDYKTTGSDSSEIFVKRYSQKHPNADVVVLDATSFRTKSEYQGIFSNKVLQHLTIPEVQTSLRSQGEALAANGVAFHTLWYGTGCDEYSGLRFQQYTLETFSEIIPSNFSITHSQRYSEMEENDSIIIVLEKVESHRQSV